MNQCFNCGYMYADCDECGEPTSLEYCHFEGPNEWAPCEQGEYEEWLMEQAIADEDYRSTVEYYSEPYDYEEF